MSVKAKPDGYHTATPYLVIRGAKDAIEFYKNAFGAKELLRLENPDGSVAHAEVLIGDSPIMIGEEMKEMGYLSPKSVGGTGSSIMLYVDDADSIFAQAVAAGGQEERPVADQFYGDRSGMLLDPFGHRWAVATHIEDLTQDEVNRRFAEMLNCQSGESSTVNN
ncbi:MAG: VOC family protein [Planctomycetales bacterium]|nr:VOC family protein [Planctomycetales bacterium]